MSKYLIVLAAFFAFELQSQNNTIHFIPSKTNSFTNPSSTLLLNQKSFVFFNERNVNDFAEVKKLEVQQITDQNTLESIKNKISSLPKLEEITFNDCDLIIFPFEFSTYTKLKSLKITNSILYNQYDILISLKNTPSLEELGFSFDEYGEIPDSLHLLENLKNITIQNINARTNSKNIFHSTITYTVGPNTSKTISVDELGFENSAVSEYTQTAVQSTDQNLAFTNKVVNPPIKNMRINDSTYNIDSRSDNTLNYYSGTSLFLPRDAFTTASGQDYAGNVKVFYREFRNPVDILLSGIPMTNQEHGDTNQFVSAGMYELWAYNDKNEKLRLKPEKKITVDFKPTTDTGTYKFYSLDTTSGNWTSSKQSVNLSKSSAANTKESWAMRAFLSERRRFLNKSPDHTTFENRFYSTDYAGIINIKNFSFNKDSSKFVLGGSDSDKKSKIKSPYRINGIRVTKKGDVLFKFAMRDDQLFGYDFGFGQRLHALSNKQLKLAGGIMTKQEFKNKFLKQIIVDIRLVENGSNLILKLKTKSGIIDLPFNIVDYDESTREYIGRPKVEKAIARHFNIRLKSIARNYDKKNIKLQNWNWYDFIKKPDRASANELAYGKIKHYLSKEEKKLSLTTFVRQADSLEAIIRVARSTEIDVTFNKSLDTIVAKTNSVLINSNLGFNNIDCYLHKGLVMDLYVEYKSPDLKETIKTNFATTIVNGINTSINNYSPENEKAVKIRYIKGKDFTLLRLDEEGYIQADKLIESKLSKTLTLPLINKISIKNKSSEEIARLIGL